MTKKNKRKILISITGDQEKHWKSKLEDIERYKIKEIGLFLERFTKSQRDKIYKALSESKIESIPLVHIRNDMKKEELLFLFDNFGSKYFTIHEDSFKYLEKWKGYYKYLFLEMNIDNFVSQSVRVNKIGGFCVDLAHFKIEITKWSREFEYIFERRKTDRYFKCNHLNGYSSGKNRDMHTVERLQDFEYLKTLPKFVFGDIISLETENRIKDQLEYKKYLTKMIDEILD
jgi:hypothetical protein